MVAGQSEGQFGRGSPRPSLGMMEVGRGPCEEALGARNRKELPQGRSGRARTVAQREGSSGNHARLCSV